ncbi:hypothetical protein BpHYR1_005748 [Brachionus plicatilis]|uniref:Uncharacterized protein n=1 Tax=Brachionus plicatilis TaxID=10195 RepID=A0A3M7S1M8_BRAPC|nr:hypothetical protein BpHYR1_005748 [Brachionus plicatilis]
MHCIGCVFTWLWVGFIGLDKASAEIMDCSWHVSHWSNFLMVVLEQKSSPCSHNIKANKMR